MLTINIPENELFNSETNEFVYLKNQTLQLEHSLLSISKWEAKWGKPFIGDGKTNEETIDYIRCMCITKGVDDAVFENLPASAIQQVQEYINAPMTATTINNMKQTNQTNRRRAKEVVTSELIYYWMIRFGIPFECEKWHLNRLLMLIRVCDIKESPGKSMGRNEIYQQNKALNEARKKRLNTKG